MPNEVFPSADKKSAVIRSGYPPQTSMMTTSEVDETLVAFGRCRAVMLPAYPDTWPRDQAVECDRDPKFDFANDHLAGDVLFRIRDERFGWRHYIITKDKAAEIGAMFSCLANAPAPSTSGSA